MIQPSAAEDELSGHVEEEDDPQDRAIVVVPDVRAELVQPAESSARGNPALAYLETLAKNSRVTMRDALRRLVRYMGQSDPKGIRYQTLPWWKLKPFDTTTLRRLLLEGNGAQLEPVSVNTAKVTLAALRGVLHQCWRLEYITGDAFERLVAWPCVVGDEAEPAGRMLSPAEVAQIFEVAGRQPPLRAALDTAIVRLGLMGLRREEIAALLAAWLEDDTLRVLGKRRKVRVLQLDDETIDILWAWLAQRNKCVEQGIECGSMFFCVLSDKVVGRPMSKWQVWDRMRALSERSGVEFRPHDLRRTAASILAQTVDPMTAARILGHEDPRTTMRYDMRGKETHRKAAGAFAEKLRKGWST